MDNSQSRMFHNYFSVLRSGNSVSRINRPTMGIPHRNKSTKNLRDVSLRRYTAVQLQICHEHVMVLCLVGRVFECGKLHGL